VIPKVSLQALILSPLGRDALLAQSILAEAGIDAAVCSSLPDLVDGLRRGAAFAVVAEEAIHSADMGPLVEWLNAQPEWSDFPFVLLTSKGGGIERNPAASRYLDLLGNVTFLERPFHPTTFVSLAKSALRGRRRQYDASTRLDELRDGAAKYQSLFDSIDAGFCIIEMVFGADGKPCDYRFVEANPAFALQTGLTNAIGRVVSELLPGHEHYWAEKYGNVSITGIPVRFENIASAMGDIWFEVYAFPAEFSGPGQVGVLFNDITARRNMENELRHNEERLRRLNDSLEERVEQRTSELSRAQDQLRQAQKLEAIGQLTGGVAHDFNNLLMAVLSSLSLLRKRVPADDSLLQLIDNAVQGAERGAALTQRMLAFARRQDLASEQIDIPELVQGMIGLIERTLGPAWPVKVEMEAAVPAVVGDPNQLEMALLNLVVNARDAMPGGGIVRIASIQREIFAGQNDILGLSPGHYVGLSVTDTGHGMDEATLERATEPFFTTKGIGKGTGLGLPMVHGLAKQLGGSIQLKSKLGEGTTAILWLPAAALGAEQIKQTAAPKEIAHMQPTRLKVLAVDDDVLVLMNMAALLEDLGHEVIEASSGPEALAKLAQHPDLDLLITDQAMPDMTGAQLVKEVVALRPDLPIILATGYGELPPGFQQSIIKLGKPFSQDVLKDAVAQALSQQQRV